MLFLGYGVSLIVKGGVPKWSNGAGCKPVDFGLRKFESFPSTMLIKAYNDKERVKFGLSGVVQW